MTYLSLQIKYLNNKDLKEKRGILYIRVRMHGVLMENPISNAKECSTKATFHWNKMLALLTES